MRSFGPEILSRSPELYLSSPCVGGGGKDNLQQKAAEHTYIHWVINWNSPKTEERNGLNSPAMRQRPWTS